MSDGHNDAIRARETYERRQGLLHLEDEFIISPTEENLKRLIGECNNVDITPHLWRKSPGLRNLARSMKNHYEPKSHDVQNNPLTKEDFMTYLNRRAGYSNARVPRQIKEMMEQQGILERVVITAYRVRDQSLPRHTREVINEILEDSQ